MGKSIKIIIVNMVLILQLIFITFFFFFIKSKEIIKKDIYLVIATHFALVFIIK